MAIGFKQINTRGAWQAWLPFFLLPAGALAVWAVAVYRLAGGAVFAWVGQHSLSLGWAVVVSAAVWLIPGLAVLRLLWPGRALGALERLALAICVGIALPPLVLELAHTIRLPWNTWATLAYVVVSAGVAFYPSHMRRAKVRARQLSALAWPAFWLAGLTLLTLVQRLYLVRDLVVGPWGDSVHHTMMTQLLVDNHGLFSSWLPYAPLTTFTYHFGFQANAAFITWLGGFPVTQSVILTGQLLSVSSLPAAYLLTVRLSRNRSAGLWAALITAFVNLQPAYYLNWGRYTQLAGQVVLPAVLVAWMAAVGSGRLRWRPLLLAGLLSCCLALTHYIVTIFAALFILAYAVSLVLREPQRATVIRVGAGSAAIGLIGLVLAAPWLANTLNGFLVRNATGFVNGAVSTSRIASYAGLQPISGFYVKTYLLGLALLGWLAAVARRKWTLAMLPVWLLLLLLAVAPNLVNLPGAGVVDFFAVYIALYLPVIPGAAYVLGALQTWAGGRWPRLAAAGTATAWIALSALGFAWQQDNLLVRQFELFTAADARAVDWIKANTAPDARIFVNAFPAYGGSLIAGSDGGWWLPLLAGRQTNLPPLTYGSERGPIAGYSRQVNALAVQFRGRPLADSAPVSLDLTTDANDALLLANNFRYVYIGAHANPGPDSADHIDAARLQARPDLFQRVYEQDGVQIYRIEPRP